MHLLILAALLAASPGDSMLVSPEWLTAHRTTPGLVILHVSMEKAEYGREHVSGARWLDPHTLIRNGPPGTELPPIEAIDSVLDGRPHRPARRRTPRLSRRERPGVQ